jgi:hypothetical protein
VCEEKNKGWLINVGGSMRASDMWGDEVRGMCARGHTRAGCRYVWVGVCGR